MDYFDRQIVAKRFKDAGYKCEIDDLQKVPTEHRQIQRGKVQSDLDQHLARKRLIRSRTRDNRRVCNSADV
jgi:hypothetical protein